MTTNSKIQWQGGNCPVHMGTKVKVWFDNGVSYTLIAGNLDWSVKPRGAARIIAYKVQS